MEENIEQTINTQNYQSQDSLQSSVVVEKKKTILPYLLSLLAILFLALTLYFYNQTQDLKNQLTVVASPSPVAEPKVSADPYQNWDTYSNSVHNVSFKYPLGWQLTKENDLAKYNASIKLTKDQATIHMIFGVDGIGGSGMDYEGESVTLDGNKVFKYKAHNTYDNSESIGITDTLKESLGVLMLDKKTYVINLKYPTKYTDSGESINLEKTFDEILSTFKFTSINSGSKYTLEEIGNACISLQGSTKYWNTKYRECIESGTPKDQLEAFCSKYGGDFVSNASTCRHAGEEGIPCGPEATYYCGF